MRVLITGGTGSLGQALVERLYKDHAITVYSRDEVKQSEMRRKYADSDVRYMLGDVRDYDRLMLAMRGQEAVLHAAAYKQVPSAEANVDEAIATNVYGSLNVARAAVFSDVVQVVGVSTDKACAPINAYGQTKALMERLFQQAGTWGDTDFNCVRYGNVLGSRGSVVPLFKRQAKAGKYTLTNPNMTRFWMTLDQAVDLVLEPINNEHVSPGDILVPTCAASTMMDLLRACADIWASNPDPAPEDIKIIGTRPGEKIHEQLIHSNESLLTRPTSVEMPYFEIMPADSPVVEGRLPFEYDSEQAPQLTIDELVDMIQSSVIADA